MSSSEEKTLTLDDGGNKEPQNLIPDSTNACSKIILEEHSAPKTLEMATELFSKGSSAIKEGDFVEAVDCLSRALEIRVENYGELAPECATSYYKYGCALLYKSQEEADPLGNVPKNPPTKSEKDKSLNLGASDAKECNASSKNEEAENGASDKEQEDDSEGSDGDAEESADEDDSDLDLAWKMLDVARAIFEKSSEDNMEKVNVYSALGEVSMEREDFETSLNDYLKGLSMLERLVEPDNRRTIELNFRVSLVLEVWGKLEEAIPYCEKAISLCKSRLQRLNENVNQTALPGNDADPSVVENEKEVLGGIQYDLERKLEDLHQVLSNPKPILAEIMKTIADKFAAGKTESGSVSLNSSQMGAVNVNSCFDSPTISTAATNGSSASVVTHLGVVGRGVKRASSSVVDPDSSSKKLSLDSSSSDKDGSSVSQAVDSTVVQDAEAPK